MEAFLVLIDKYTIMILIAITIAFALLFLIRSFKRSMLIDQGRARFVLEVYDARTEKIHKWLIVVILFFLLPLLAYARYFRHLS